jgi:hypothetical protein
VYPHLTHSGRRYAPNTEARHWDLARVLSHLSEYVIRRKVDPQGTPFPGESAAEFTRSVGKSTRCERRAVIPSLRNNGPTALTDGGLWVRDDFFNSATCISLREVMDDASLTQA